MSEWIISTEDIDDITGGGFTVGQTLVRCENCVHKYVCELYSGGQFFCAYGEIGEAND